MSLPLCNSVSAEGDLLPGTVTDLHSLEGVFCVFQEAEKLVATVIPKHLAEAAPEVAVYLKESVGNSTRIDYGTGTRGCMLVEA